MRYVFGVLGIAALSILLSVGCGGGQVFPCTEQGIRDAIAHGGGTHTFECDGPTTVVTAAQIEIDNDVILDGEGDLTVDGNGDHRVFSVSTGVTTELRAMTVTRGWAQDAGPVNGIEGPGVPTHRTFGGGIVSIGTLTLRDTTVSQHSADAGGGIYSEGTLMLTGSTVSENGAQSGAGIVNGGSGTMTLANSTVSRNWAATFGGGLGAGIYNEGEMSIINSTISENQGSHAPGGGIYNAASGTLSVIKSTVSKNHASADGPGRGGGIYNGGEMTIMNSIVSENGVAGAADPGASGSGGGIYSSGWMLLINTTVSSNTAYGVGGGIYSWGWMSLTNTTVASNLADSADAIYIGRGWAVNEGAAYLEVARTVIHGDCGKDTEAGPNVTWVSLGYNIESPGDTCGFDPDGTDQLNVSTDDLKLGELADNGGPTMTHALGVDSVAIDHIPEVDCEVTEDQRGEPRPETGGTMCDVGALEVQP